MRSPRSFLRRLALNFRMFSRSSRMRVPGATVARLESSPMTVRAVTDFPDPDSPTIAIVSPRWSWKDTWVTASTIPPSTLNVTAMFRASRISERPWLSRSKRSGRTNGLISAIGASVGIDRVAQSVAKRVEGEDGDEHEHDRRQDPRIGTFCGRCSKRSAFFAYVTNSLIVSVDTSCRVGTASVMKVCVHSRCQRHG